MIDLAQALRLGGPPCLAFSGAGGKTTALFLLARQLLQRSYPTVLVSVTTHLADSQLCLADACFRVGKAEKITSARLNLPLGIVLFVGRDCQAGRVSGLDNSTLEGLLALARERRLPLLIEADGSRQRPLKAPAEHEPAIPPFVDMVVVTAGLTGINQPLSPDWVHRAEIYADLSALKLGSTITLEAAVRVLSHPLGGLKGIPAESRRVLLLNQADTPELRLTAEGLASRALPGFSAVLVAALDNPLPGQPSGVFSVHEPIAGAVLAAGGASRFGSPKQLLEWQGVPLVRQKALLALEAGLNPVHVVTGAYGSQVAAVLDDLPITLVDNPHWQHGQSTSVKAAVQSFPSETGGAIFFLADQLSVSLDLVNSLIRAHAATLSPMVVPLCQGQRATPILFDRQIFPDLLGLSGDVGGRALLSEYSPTWVAWDDPELLVDVDTPADYEKYIGAGK